MQGKEIERFKEMAMETQRRRPGVVAYEGEDGRVSNDLGLSPRTGRRQVSSAAVQSPNDAHYLSPWARPDAGCRDGVRVTAQVSSVAGAVGL